MTPDNIMNGMQEKNRLLTAKTDEYIILSERAAQANRDYNTALAKKMLELRIDSQPTTLIPVLAKGDKAVSELKYQLDVAEGIVNACRESIKDIRSAIDSYRSILTWKRAEYERAGTT